MGFIKLPKSTTDLTSFDLMNIYSQVADIKSASNTKLQIEMINPTIAGAGNDENSLYEITTSTMTDLQRLRMIQNLSLAVQEVALTPNSVPVLTVVTGVTISSLTYRQVL